MSDLPFAEPTLPAFLDRRKAAEAPCLHDTKAELDAIAVRIREWIKKTTANIVEIGQDLIAAKAQFAHGDWLPWLRNEFGWSARTATNYMRAAEFAAANRKSVADLPAATLYLLAAPSTPKNVKTEVISDIEAGKPVDHSAIAERVKAARKAKAKVSSKPRETEAKKGKGRARAAKSAAHEAVTILRNLPSERFNRLRVLLGVPGALQPLLLAMKDGPG